MGLGFWVLFLLVFTLQVILFVASASDIRKNVLLWLILIRD